VRTVSKKAKYCKEKAKKPNNYFLTPTAFKKAKFVKFGVKKANLATMLSDSQACELSHFVLIL